MNSVRFTWKTVLAYLLAAFFLVGAVGNILALGQIADDYARWGYPDWFHYLTGTLELITSILLLRMRTRLWGALLGAAVMAAAAGTVLMHGEFTHAIAPAAVLAICLLVARSGGVLRPAM